MMPASQQIKLFDVFAWMWALALLFHVQMYGHEIINQGSPLHLLLFSVCLLLLYKPGSILLFLSTSFLLLIVGWQSFPQNISNHFFIEFLFAIGVLASFFKCVIQEKSLHISREHLFNHISVIGRWFLLLMYFFGVFHKINSDWFNPDASCAVALWKSFFWRLPGWLENALWAKYAAIYGTLIIETIIILILCFYPRWSRLAVLSGLLFHGFIGMNAYAQYWNFSTLSFALHFLFLPETVGKRWQDSKIYQTISRNKYTYIIIKLIPCFVMVFLLHDRYGRHLTASYIAWIIIWGGAIAFVLIMADYKNTKRHLFLSRNMACVTIPMVLLFLVNGLSPYLGLKTESAIAMYSNLYTELGKTNHLLFTKPPYLFDYQNQPVRILKSSDRQLQRMANRKRPMLLHHLRQHIYRRYDRVKHHSLVYKYKGEVFSTSRIQDDPLLKTGYLGYKLLVLKPLDFSRPKRCTH